MSKIKVNFKGFPKEFPKKHGEKLTFTSSPAIYYLKNPQDLKEKLLGHFKQSNDNKDYISKLTSRQNKDGSYHFIVEIPDNVAPLFNELVSNLTAYNDNSYTGAKLKAPPSHFITVTKLPQSSNTNREFDITLKKKVAPPSLLDRKTKIVPPNFTPRC